MSTVYCFDLDGTVTRDEILPVLSREIGLFEEISALTDATIKGFIPFRKSFMLRCRLLAEVPVSRVREIIRTQVRLNQEIVQFIRSKPEQCCIITGNLDIWIEPLIADLGCRSFHSTASMENDRLKSVDTVLNKGDAVRTLRDRFERIVVVGDGMGDVPMFEAADVRVAYGGSHLPVQMLVQLSDYVTFNPNALCRLLSTL